MRRPGPIVLCLAALLAAGTSARVPARTSCDLPGPLSDYWPKVVRDWSRRVPGLNFGPAQTAAWVSLVYGDSGSGDRKLGQFVRRWSALQEWNWVRSEIWRRPYSRVAEGRPEDRLGFQQNLMLQILEAQQRQQQEQDRPREEQHQGGQRIDDQDDDEDKQRRQPG